MDTAAQGTVMARPKGRPKRSERDDVTVKIDRKLIVRAKYVASFRGISVAELLSDLLEAPLAREFARIAKESEGKL